MTIMEKIQLHSRVYSAYDIQPPPFRITCAEHKELVEYRWPALCSALKEGQSRRIVQYISVDLELVTTVEDYC